MSMDGPPALSRARSAAALVVLLAVAVCGVTSAGAWPAIFAGAVLLLFTSDRGQHRWLAERDSELSRGYVVALSIGAHLLNNLHFTTLSFITGRVTRLFWWDALDGVPGAWGELALWLIAALIVVAIGQAAWRWLEHAGRR